MALSLAEGGKASGPLSGTPNCSIVFREGFNNQSLFLNTLHILVPRNEINLQR